MACYNIAKEFKIYTDIKKNTNCRFTKAIAEVKSLICELCNAGHLCDSIDEIATRLSKHVNRKSKLFPPEQIRDGSKRVQGMKTIQKIIIMNDSLD